MESWDNTFFYEDKVDSKKLFTANEMMALLHEMDDILGNFQVNVHLQIYGGAIMCNVYHSREFTEDIDASYRNFELINPIIESLATKYNLPKDWLNNNVEDIKSALKSEDMVQMAGFNNMTITYPSAEHMLALKLYAARLSPKSDLKDAVHLCKLLNLTKRYELECVLNKYIYKDALGSKNSLFITKVLEVVNNE